MKLKTFLSIIVLSVVVISCSKDDDNNDALSLSFSPNAYDAVFYVPGETEAGTVVSSLGEPEISLAPGTDPAFSYNALTGKVEWSYMLPLGENVATVVAKVGDREATTDILVNNVFQGDFSGGYNYDEGSTALTSVNFALQFNPDGTLLLNDDGAPGTGTWTRMDNLIEFTWSYDAEPGVFYTFHGETLVYNAAEAYLSGLWYDGEDTSGAVQGYFRINYQD